MSTTPIRTLADLPEHHAAGKPDSVALVYGDTRVSFRDLDRTSNRVANALIEAGIDAQQNVAILDRNSERFFYALFGCAKANVSLVTVNFRLTANEVQYILADSEARLLYVGKEFLPVIEACRDQLPLLQHIIVLDGDAADDNALLRWIDGRSDTKPMGRIASVEDRAVQMYTSGTTGHPKGVELSHRAMVAAAEEGLSIWPAMYTPDSAVLAIMPLFHIAAANLCIAGLHAGARAEILREATPAEIIEIIAHHGIRIAPLPVPIIHAIIDLPDIGQYDLSGFDTLLIAGSGIAVDLLQRAQAVLGCGFALSYGMTECCGGVTYLGRDDCTYDAGERLKSAGTLFGASRIKIVDSERNEVPNGVIGEIACHCVRVMSGYWKRPEATAEAISDGWYYSGDAGYVDDDGFLYVVDRIKDMVVSGGENIYPVEIENELIKHPAVKECAVIGVPDEKWGEALLACVVNEPGVSAAPDELIAFLRERLAGYKIPRQYQFIDALPRNATGKVLKRELRAEWGNVNG